MYSIKQDFHLVSAIEQWFVVYSIKQDFHLTNLTSAKYRRCF